MLLITLTIGWREGVVVLVIIPTTILLTLFASWLMGYTINRVSLFALIFSIGILVDDAIVVVENIVRHWQMRGERGLIETAVEAVAEVGNPTIVATLTIIVALLPMMFVERPDGPLHEPDSGQRLDGDAVLLLRRGDDHALAAAEDRRQAFRTGAAAPAMATTNVGAMGRFYARIATPLLDGAQSARRAFSSPSASPRCAPASCSPPRPCA